MNRWPRATGRPFIKMHGLRNHFVIVDVRDEPWRPEAATVAAICDGQAGVGADQLILVEPSDTATAFMRILNTDGREAEACGNATRCVAWLLMQELGRDDLALETRAGRLACARVGDEVRCEMGRVHRDWQRIPLARECDTLALPVQSGPLEKPVAVNVGNPHAVFFVPDIAAIDIARHAPAVQQDPLFPNRVNVGVAEVVSERHLRLAVYERGAGLTMACGSGACAAVYAAAERGLIPTRDMVVSLPGGDVQVQIRDDDVAVMTGPVAVAYSGRLPA